MQFRIPIRIFLSSIALILAVAALGPRAKSASPASEPQTQQSQPSPQQLPAARVVDLKTSDGTVLKASYFAAAKPGPGVLLFHQFNRQRRDWDDLALPRWKGKLVIRDPVPSGTMRAIFGAILQRSILETGNTDRGFDYLRKLDANTREYTASPTILYQKLGRREGVITLYNMPDLATLQERTKIPVKAVIPSSGTPVLVDAIAIVKGARHPEEAKAFYNFIASREQMMIAAKDHLRIPARNDIPLDSLPQWIRTAKTQIKPMPLDRQLMADSLNVWMTYWDTHIRNRFRGK